MTNRPNLDDYNDVASRIQEFRQKHPEGTLQPADPSVPFQMVTVQMGERSQTYVVVAAAAYRSPDDPRPGIGTAWEQVPGATPYTRGSEIQNCETSAWGRALIAVGAADARKGIASAEEVAARKAPAQRQSRQRSEPEQQDGPRMISEPMSRRLHQLFNQSGITERDARLNYTSEIVKREVPSSNDLTFSEARLLIKTLEDALAEPRDENPDDGGTA